MHTRWRKLTQPVRISSLFPLLGISGTSHEALGTGTHEWVFGDPQKVMVISVDKGKNMAMPGTRQGIVNDLWK